MTWNPHHAVVNEVRYQEPDLQAAYQHYRDMYAFYEVQIKYKYKFPDTTPIQHAFDKYLRLRKKYHGNHRRPSDKATLQGPGARRAV